ncbi:hypothetical protein P8452_43106 [Trifolium repens]|nr:hypothetical protein P8452_43106 [Trifolium repens]
MLFRAPRNYKLDFIFVCVSCLLFTSIQFNSNQFSILSFCFQTITTSLSLSSTFLYNLSNFILFPHISFHHFSNSPFHLR